MPTLIPSPGTVAAAGTKPKRVDEFIGRVNTATDGVRMARMRSPAGWTEPGLTPAFDQFTIVLQGVLRVAGSRGIVDVKAGQAMVAHRGEWVQYSTRESGGADYIAEWVPAPFLATVHRDC